MVRMQNLAAPLAALCLVILCGCAEMSGSGPYGATRPIAKSVLTFPSEAKAVQTGGPRGSYLFRPGTGEGPYPGVVLMPPCGGVGPQIFPWAQMLTSAGYMVLVVDSLTPRGVSDNCKAAWEATVSLDTAAADAAAALGHLRSLPLVRSDSLAVVGFSFGAIASVRLASESYQRRLAGGAQGLKAIALFYPACTSPSPDPTIRAAYEWPSDVIVPIDLFVGGRDDEGTPSACVSAAERLKAKGAAYKLYANATHAFDDARFQSGREIRRPGRPVFYYQYDPDATRDARNRVLDFLEEHLLR